MARATAITQRLATRFPEFAAMQILTVNAGPKILAQSGLEEDRRVEVWAIGGVPP
ncbi:MAG TPA: hypothetical protein VIY49_04055 [Bryobacteraceae bacterium]